MSAERLFDLLPTIVKLRDGRGAGAGAGGGAVLEALLGVVQEQADRLADDVDDLYEDWFIETCRDWVVPYIAELVSARSHYAFGEGALSLRAFVADTLHFRRRKGTASMLEDLASSVTGWNCRALEIFTRLATTQNVNHVRPGNVWTPDLRETEALERVGGAFDDSNRAIDVRSIAAGRGRYNVPNVALFLWRLQALKHRPVAAVPDASAGAGRFRLDPLGVDRPIFNPARTLQSLDHSVSESDVPAPARRRPLANELEAARAALAGGGQPTFRYFADTQPIVTLTPLGEAEPIPPERLQVCSLDDWTTLPPPVTVSLPSGGSFTTVAVVDPRTGRIAFHGTAPAAVLCTHHYGAVALIGGGHFPRGQLAEATPDVTVAVTDFTQATSPALADALSAWVPSTAPTLLVEIADSGHYDVPAPLTVPAGAHLTIRSRDRERAIVRAAAPWQVTLGSGATLVLDGIWLAGGPLAITVDGAGGAAAARLQLRQTTLVPGLFPDVSGAPTAAGTPVLLTAVASTGALQVVAQHAVLGRVDLGAGAAGFVADLRVEDSIIDDAVDDSSAAPAEALRAHALQIDRSTVLGATHARTLDASDCIFLRTVTVERTQQGCVRFSFVPSGSKVPRTFRCQPALALAGGGPGTAPVDTAAVLARMAPAFTSTRFGEPAYGQLARETPVEIRTGGNDGSEMGAHFHLHQPQREANLRQGLDEYLRFGLEAGLIFAS